MTSCCVGSAGFLPCFRPPRITVFPLALTALTSAAASPLPPRLRPERWAVKARTASFCTERSGYNEGGANDQGLAFYLPNGTWLQPPGFVHKIVHDTWLPHALAVTLGGAPTNLSVSARTRAHLPALIRERVRAWWFTGSYHLIGALLAFLRKWRRKQEAKPWTEPQAQIAEDRSLLRLLATNNASAAVCASNAAAHEGGRQLVSIASVERTPSALSFAVSFAFYVI